ncbi:MAG: tRNA pseudouridine(38-40) synthase TruA [Candidatus Thorarchaeota archaeon]|nr:MAG: tRNA pseudouridine(38-40) synthase TruA [Candidatus Thorarchaeota archaeon]
MADYLARLFYLGDDYHGSQMQPGLKTVQGELIRAISKWSGEPHSSHTVQLSGRTDRGVHSLGQLVMVSTDRRLSIDGINKHLPEDIVLWAWARAPEGFKPRSGALIRHYRYFLDESWNSINQDRIREAITLVVGSNDFLFLSKPDERRNTVTTVLNVSIGEISNIKFLDIFGTSFLWKFVRKVVTLLTEIGLENMKPETILEVLDGGKKTIRGGIEPAPPENLVLMETVVPFRLTTSKYALRRIQNYLTTHHDFLRRSNLTLSGLTNHFSSSIMFSQRSTSSRNP